MVRAYKFVILAILVLHVFLTPIFVNMAYADRGYMAVGSEYFVLPFIGALMLLGVKGLEVLENKSKSKPKRRMNHGKSNSNDHR